MWTNYLSGSTTKFLKNISSDALTDKCKDELEIFFKQNFKFDTVKINEFPLGRQWLSIPLRVTGFKNNKQTTYVVKVVTEKSLETYNTFMAMRRLGFILLANVDCVLVEKFESTYDIIQYEQNCLKNFKCAGISVPDIVGGYRLCSDSLLIMDFIAGHPLGKIELTTKEICQVFRVIKLLRDHNLVHGDIKLDNFLIDCTSDLYLIDCMKYHCPREQALSYDLMSAIYSLSQKYDVISVLKLASKFFSDEDIKESLRFLELARARIDLLFQNDKTDEITYALTLNTKEQFLKNVEK